MLVPINNGPTINTSILIKHIEHMNTDKPMC